MWVPDVYQGGPTPIVTFLSIASKSAGFALLIKIFLLIFEYTDWTYIIAVIAVITMTVGNAGALLQDNSKRLLGYSGIAHAGYILIGIACFSTVNNIDGQVAVIFYLFTYSFANLAAFYSLMSLSQSTNSYSIQSYAGSFFHNKISSIVLMLALISLIGLPPTSGFIGKLYLFNMAIKSELILLVLFGVLNSVLSSFYYLKVIRILFQSNSNIAPNSSNSSVLLNSVLISTGLAILIIGIYPDPVLQLVETVVTR
jgi:NADH-quinone oxidoreductase subunit N